MEIHIIATEEGRTSRACSRAKASEAGPRPPAGGLGTRSSTRGRPSTEIAEPARSCSTVWRPAPPPSRAASRPRARHRRTVWAKPSFRRRTPRKRSEKAKALRRRRPPLPSPPRPPRKTATGRRRRPGRVLGAVAALAAEVAGRGHLGPVRRTRHQADGRQEDGQAHPEGRQENSAKEYAKQQKKALRAATRAVVLAPAVAGGVGRRPHGAPPVRCRIPGRPRPPRRRASASPVNTNSTVAAGTGVKGGRRQGPHVQRTPGGTATRRPTAPRTA
ncbi:hypothetical protein QJS66_14500 [Kocuria rhizophila]|nr:hypothetical protein QJS66_14500 [Kocuria rhizophila]